MAEQIINIGTTANDGTGDTLRESQRKSKEFCRVVLFIRWCC
jgi:hypothetical protein